MKTYTIPKKIKISEGGNGALPPACDLASYDRDRKIKFNKGYKYAVVLAANYGPGLDGYITHKTPKTAAATSHLSRDLRHTIIDRKGKEYKRNLTRNGWELIAK